MPPGETSGVAIDVSPFKLPDLARVIIKSYGLMAAVFAVRGGELATISYHTPYDLKDFKANTTKTDKDETDSDW